MTRVLLGCLFCLIVSTVGCSAQNAEELFETAQFEERQHNVAHAKELYQEIVTQHPGGEPAKKAQERLAQLARVQ